MEEDLEIKNVGSQGFDFSGAWQKNLNLNYY